jgi:hypothetical protein
MANNQRNASSRMVNMSGDVQRMGTERLDRRPAAARVPAIALTIVATVEALARLHVPRVLGAALVLSCVLAAITALLDATWAPARSWLDSAPQTVAAIEGNGSIHPC